MSFYYSTIKFIQNKTPPKDGETKRFARTDENKLVVGIPDVVGVAIVVVEPKLGLIAVQVEHVEIAVRINNAQAPPTSLPFEVFKNDLRAVSNSASSMR